jgi:hypothetical protein
MKALNFRTLVLSAASLALVGIASPASAAGCNGVVNIFVWGCAPWDNNNGKNHPYFRKKAITIPAAGTRIVTEKGVPMALRNGTYYPLIGQDGAGIISSDGAGIVSSDGASIRVWSPN